VGVVGVVVVVAGGSGAVTDASANPTRIWVPAGRPPWSAVSRMSSAVMFPRYALSVGAAPCASTIA
jgi:hypothetical protein